MNFSELEFELIRPSYLWGLLVIPLIAYVFLRSLVDFPVLQKRISLAIRVVILGLLVLAVSGLTLLSPTTDQFVVVVVDDSVSINKDDQTKTIRAITEYAENQSQHEVRVLRFSSGVSKIETLDESRNRSDQKKVESNSKEVRIESRNTSNVKSEDDLEQKMGTNIASAIEIARASIPPFYVPKIVLISDGNETDGDAIQAALSAEVPINTILSKTRSDPEVQVSDVEVPAQVRQGEPFYVKVAVSSNIATEADIEIYRGPLLLETSTQKLKEGLNEFRFRQSVDNERLAEYTIRVKPKDDTLVDNNQAAGLVYSTGQPRVLLIESDVRTTRDFVYSLREQKIQCDVRPPEGIPADLSDLQNYEAVILSNVPATKLSLRQMDVMRTYVQDLGGGLIMLGGDQSFGLGGYYKTTLEEILPVRSDFEKEKEKPSLAMVLIVDKSGSMGGQKMELAKDAAKAAVELLGKQDQVGVIAFDSESYWVSELHSAADRSYIMDRISTIEASGGTSIYPGMEMAFDSLNSAVAKLKHVILLTDGHSSPGDFEGIASQMASSRMTLSTVAVGSSADQDLLELMARVGNGRYYFCDDPQSVPQIFAKETVTASKSAINEQPFIPQLIRPTPVLSNLDMDTAPFLLGYVVTRPKPTSEFILATEAGDPLLVWWRYGLGVTVAFTSDAKNRWAAEWLSWPDFGTFWAQVIRHVMRKSDSKGTYVEVVRKGNKATVIFDTVDAVGQFRNKADSKLTIIDPALGKKELEMKQIAPGRYQAELETTSQGTYHLELSQKVNNSAVRQTRGLTVGYPEELRLRPPNAKMMKEIANVTGGRYADLPGSKQTDENDSQKQFDSSTLNQIFEIGDRTVQQATPLWPYLLTAALILFLLDVALRRLDFSLILGRFRKVV